MFTIEDKLTTEQRVAAGIAFLNKDMPGWEHKVDLTRFTDIGDPHCCVLTQVYGDFPTGVNKVIVNSPYGEFPVATHGFVGVSFEPDRVLTHVWKQEILKLQEI